MGALGPVLDHLGEGQLARPGHTRGPCGHNDVLEGGHPRLEAFHGGRRVVLVGGGAADHGPRLAVLEEGLHLAGAVGHVHGQQHAAHHGDAEVGDQVLGPVGQLDGHRLALPDAEVEHGAGDAARPVKDLAIGKGAVRSQDGDLVGGLPGPFFGARW